MGIWYNVGRRWGFNTMIDIYEEHIERDGELEIYHYGMERCDSGHSFGPAVRDHYLIHFISDGRGIFRAGDNVYKLGKNQAFLIMPGIITYYEADRINPWTYSWIGFNGTNACSILSNGKLTMENPIFNFDQYSIINECMEQLLRIDSNKYGSNFKKKAYLYMLLSEIQRINYERYHGFHKNNQKELYIDKAIRFIEMNYSMEITVQNIADYIGLNRSYLCEIFKKYADISPQGYLINYRMKKAAGLLSTSALTVGDISRSVGYNDPLCFSKVFKRTMGVSPVNYRKTLK